MRGGVNFEKFSSYIHSKNINKIVNILEDAALEIDRNVQSKYIFFDVSLLLAKEIHVKESM